MWRLRPISWSGGYLHLAGLKQDHQHPPTPPGGTNLPDSVIYGSSQQPPSFQLKLMLALCSPRSSSPWWGRLGGAGLAGALSCSPDPSSGVRWSLASRENAPGPHLSQKLSRSCSTVQFAASDILTGQIERYWAERHRSSGQPPGRVEEVAPEGRRYVLGRLLCVWGGNDDDDQPVEAPPPSAAVKGRLPGQPSSLTPGNDPRPPRARPRGRWTSRPARLSFQRFWVSGLKWWVGMWAGLTGGCTFTWCFMTEVPARAVKPVLKRSPEREEASVHVKMSRKEDGKVSP